MRITAVIVATSAALALTACQKSEDRAPEASSEAVEAAGAADQAAANVSIDSAAADAQAAADKAAADEVAPATVPAASPPVDTGMEKKANSAY